MVTFNNPENQGVSPPEEDMKNTTTIAVRTGKLDILPETYYSGTILSRSW